MPTQNIDATLAAADMQAVKDAFATVLTKLPFLVNLTGPEIKSIVKIGPDSLSFVQTALTGDRLIGGSSRTASTRTRLRKTWPYSPR